MEPIESSETSAYNNTLTPGTYPKEKKLQSKHGESLKSRIGNTLPLPLSVILCCRKYITEKKSLLLVAATSSKYTSENNVSAITDSTLTQTKEVDISFLWNLQSCSGFCTKTKTEKNIGYRQNNTYEEKHKLRASVRFVKCAR